MWTIELLNENHPKVIIKQQVVYTDIQDVLHWLVTLEEQTVPPSDGLIYYRCHLVKQMVSDARSDISTHLSKSILHTQTDTSQRLTLNPRKRIKLQERDWQARGRVKVGICVFVSHHCSQRGYHTNKQMSQGPKFKTGTAKSAMCDQKKQQLYYRQWISANIVIKLPPF